MSSDKPRVRFYADGTQVAINDGLSNVVANLGTWRDKSSHSHYFVNQLSSHDLLTIYRTSWLAKRGVRTPARDATRNWRNWRAEADQISKIEAEEARLGLQKKVLEALIASRLYGGSAIYINTGAVNPAAPLGKSEQVLSLVVLTKDALTANEINKDISSEYYGRAETYSLRSNGQPVTIHASRFALFAGEGIPGDASTMFGGWGDSVLQSAIDSVKGADATVANIASLVFESKVDVMKVEGFAQLLADNKDSLILRRAVLQAAMKGNNGMLMIDAKDDYDQKSFAFAGLPDLWGKFQEWVAGAFEIPVTRLFGRSSAGLSGSGDGDERVYYDGIAQDQRLVIGPALALLDELIINQALGSRPAEIYYEWAPLRQLSESDRAEIFSKTATGLRALAGANAGEIIPLDALSDSAVNELVELGVLPGLEQKVVEYGTLAEQNGFAGGEEYLPAAIKDAAPRTLYVSRAVTNAADILKHYADQGVTGMLDADDLHVTIAYSRQPVDWMKMGQDWQSEIEVSAGGARLMEAFGPQNDTLVLAFAASELSWRHEEMKRAGASWDWPEYQPHITIANGFDGELKSVDPWVGEIKLGPEIFEEVGESEAFTDFDPNQPRDEKGKWTSGGGGGGGGAGMPPIPEGHVRLYHGSNDSDLDEVNAGGVFGGVFTSSEEGSAESHILNNEKGQLYYVDVKESDILTQRDISYEIDYDTQVAALNKVMPRLDSDDFDLAYEVVAEQKDVWDRDWDDVERVFGGDDFGEASWEGQKKRGLFAKELGFKAVEMEDEHGTSILVLPGAHLKKVPKK